MKLVEQHLVQKNDPRFAVIDAAAFACQNLYRQVSLQESRPSRPGKLCHRAGQVKSLKALSSTISLALLIQLEHRWWAVPAAREIGWQ